MTSYSSKYKKLNRVEPPSGAEHAAPVQQQMSDAAGPSWQDLLTIQQSLAGKEAELQTAQEQLMQREMQLQELARASTLDGISGTAADCIKVYTPLHTASVDAPVGAAASAWSSLLQDKVLLSTRWQCLLEEKRQLTALMQQAGSDHLKDFEPGETPMRDVTCSVITHQLDTPFFSCCFQR